MNRQHLITIALVLLTGAISISISASTAKQPTASIYTGFDVTQP